MITIFFLLSFIFAVGRCFSPYPWPINEMAGVAINSREYENKFNMKILRKQDIRCESPTEILNLDQMNLNIIKKDIIRSDAIRHLSLDRNLLTEIPSVFNYVPHLLCLNISRNRLNLHKSNPIEHDNLRIWDLSYQDRMPELELDVTSEIDDFNKTEDVYELSIFNNTGMNLSSLEVLILSGNYITALSYDFKRSFPNLQRLYLDNINARIVEPHFFDKIPLSLRIVHFENNHISNITLQHMAQVTELYLDGNPLQIIDITSTNLRILSLSNCVGLEHGRFDTPYLEYLDLSKNYVSSVSKISLEIFKSLRKLLLDYNKLKEVPKLTTKLSLIELSLSYNIITQIKTNSFEYLQSLKKLSLKGNGIERIETKSFSNLINLEYLDLSENQLKSLPEDWTLPMMNLRYLDASSNKFTTILDLAVNSESSLMHLFVKNNIFTKVTMMQIAQLPITITVYLA